MNELGGSNDRVSIIVAVAEMDSRLTSVLRASLLPVGKNDDDDSLFGSDRPLSSFSARIHLAYRLGLIDDSFARALHLIRKMRNEFAHATMPGSLNESPHKERVMQLLQLFPKSKQHRELEDDVVSDKDYPSLARLLICLILQRLAEIKAKPASSLSATKLTSLGDDLAGL